MALGIVLQRLFSTFPSGWPGVGLLLLRCSLGVALTCSGGLGLSGNTLGPSAFAQQAIAVVSGIFLLCGLWTPIVGTLATLDEIWISLRLLPPERMYLGVHIFLAVVAASVAMLGPGAWSIDSRLFGRRRFDLNFRDR